ncbi:uncharacterized protein LOC111865316 [Cryptotermes secundus]|uniref:uncharacterized protein LOC111865316 n=1 Tax=Cryptotermes secundus TaxID=105785 RepID=UPI000CD7D946|nr:uncharacterized protein LOC111865316 [Cryptotermes secundus]
MCHPQPFLQVVIPVYTCHSFQQCRELCSGVLQFQEVSICYKHPAELPWNTQGNRGQMQTVNIVLSHQRLLEEEPHSERGNFDLTTPHELQQRHGIRSELFIANCQQHV